MKVLGIEDSVFIQHNGMYVRVRHLDILYLIACSNYVKVYTRDANYLVPITLRAMIQQIPVSVFIRISRSVALGVQHIDAVRGNEIRVDGKWFLVSKTMRRELFVR